MCPITLAIVAGGAALAGAGISAYGQYQQGKYQKGMANYQADLDRQRSAEVGEQAGQQVMEDAQKRRTQLAAVRVAEAGSGSMLDANPNDAAPTWERDQSYMGAYDTSKILRDAELQEWGFETSAKTNIANGKMAMWSAKLGTVGTLVSGTGQAAGYGAQGYSSYKTGNRLTALENSGSGFDYSGVQN